MPVPDTVSHDVIIAGGGPVGLFLACELGLAGISVLVLEQAGDPHSRLKTLPFGRRGLSVATLESFDRRDLLAPLEALSENLKTRETPHWLRGQTRQPAGHFAGIQFFHDQVDQTQWPYRLPEPTTNVAADMASIEKALAIRAEALGIEIRRGFGVEDFTQSADGVTVQAGGAQFRSRWLVGCDGARSIVRKLAGIGFTGTEPEFTGYSALVTLDNPELLKPGRHYTASGMYMFNPPGTLNLADFDGGAFHRTDAVTRAHVEAVLRRISGIDVTITSLDLATTWTDRAYQATEYRSGRVLLAGDAAHVHSPLGGQGLNLGLGDAINLGWKLAATIRGDAPAGLLDSYASERHPIGAQILDWSRAQVALMRPSASSRALDAIIRDLIQTRHGATYFAERVWGIGMRYDLGDPHPLVGRSVPDFALINGSRVNQHLRDGHGLVLDFGGHPSLQAVAAGRGGKLRHAMAGSGEHLGVTALLVRPDGVIAWAGEEELDLGALEREVVRWFGAQ